MKIHFSYLKVRPDYDDTDIRDSTHPGKNGNILTYKNTYLVHAPDPFINTVLLYATMFVPLDVSSCPGQIKSRYVCRDCL